MPRLTAPRGSGLSGRPGARELAAEVLETERPPKRDVDAAIAHGAEGLAIIWTHDRRQRTDSAAVPETVLNAELSRASSPPSSSTISGGGVRRGNPPKGPLTNGC